MRHASAGAVSEDEARLGVARCEQQPLRSRARINADAKRFARCTDLLRRATASDARRLGQNSGS
jgi:hypothetical protein